MKNDHRNYFRFLVLREKLMELTGEMISESDCQFAEDTNELASPGRRIIKPY